MPNRILTKPLSDRFNDALVYAHNLHREQPRKGRDIPYIGHLLGVASLVLENGGDEDMAIAALLHDAVEDQGGLPRRDEIEKKFGKRVAGNVMGCTDHHESGDVCFDRFSGRKDGSLWYYRALVDAFRHAEARHLDDSVSGSGRRRLIAELERV